MHLEPLAAIALLLGGLFAGFVNAMAGGGSLVTLPLLIFAGLPPVVANGTNRVAVLAQSVTATWGFHRGGYLPWRLTGALLPATLGGTLLGAWVASHLSNDVFRPILGVLLVAMALLIVLKPARWTSATETQAEVAPSLVNHLAFAGIGFYGGFIQAGMGFFVLAVLVLGLRMDLVRSNGVKVAITLALTMVALGVFVAAGQVAWVEGAVLAVGNGLGGYLGARFAVARGAGWVRWILVGMVVVSGLQILGVFEWLGRLAAGA